MSPKKVKITFLYLTLIALLADINWKTTLAKILCEKDGNFTSRVEKERRHEGPVEKGKKWKE